MPLERQEVEIPFTGGMNSSELAEVQSVETMRIAKNVCHRSAGVEKSPRADRVATASAHPSSGSPPNVVGGMITHREKFFALHEQYGPMRVADLTGSVDTGKLAPIMVSDTYSGGTNDQQYERYVPARVSRHEVPMAPGRQGTTGVNRSVIASCVAEYTPFSVTGTAYEPNVIVHCTLEQDDEFRPSWTDVCTLVFSAIDADTGEPVCKPYRLQCDSTLVPAVGMTCSVLAIPYEESSYAGVLILHPYSMTGAGVNYAISRFDYATMQFLGSVVTEFTTYCSSGSGVDLKPNLTGLNNHTNVTSFRVAYVAAGVTYYPKVETRTMAGGVSGTYTGGTSAHGGVALVMGGTYPGLFTNDGAVPPTIYAERVSGAGPATQLTVRTCSASEYSSQIVAAREHVNNCCTSTTHAAWCAFNVATSVTGLGTFDGYGSASVQYACHVEAALVDFSTNPPVLFSGGTPGTPYIPGCLATRAETISGRATFGIQPWHFTLAERRLDTSIHLVQMVSPYTGAANVAGETERYNLLARIGHDRAVHYGAQNGADIGWSLPQISRCGGGASERARIAYAVDQVAGRTTLLPRGTSALVSTVDTNYCRPDFAEAQGCTWIAGGVMGRCDGQTVKTAQYLNAPSVAVALPNSTGRAWAADDYSVIAIYETKDAAGNVYRSAASTPVAFTVAGTEEPIFIVTWPLDASAEGYPTMRPRVRLFISTGGAYYPLDDGASMFVDAWSVAGWGGEFRTDNGTSIYSANTSGAPAYSAGAADEELESESPPALHSIAAIGDRLWGIDAEDRSRVWYTKPFSAGIAPEWNTACTLSVADELVAVRDVGGVPTFFAKGGIWQVYGEGPNALGSGAFAPPRRLAHNISAMVPWAVCRAQGGVAVATRGGLYMFDGAQLENFGWPVDISGAGQRDYYSELAEVPICYDHMRNELRCYSAYESGFLVFNLDTKKWAWWADGVSAEGTMPVVNELGVTMFSNCSSSTPAVYRFSDDGTAGTQQVMLETAHVKFDGLTGFGRVWEVWLMLRNPAGSNGTRATLTVTFSYDFGESSSTHTVSYSSTDFAGKTMATVRIFPTKQKMRALKIRVEETTFEAAGGSQGVIPLAARIVYGADRGRDKGRQLATG